MDVEEQDLIPLGRVGRAHGRDGEVRLWAYNPDGETLRKGLTGWLRFEDGSLRAVKLDRFRWADRFALIRVEGVRWRDAAEELCHAELVVHRDALPSIDEDEIYLVDLMGLPVWAMPDGEDAVRCIGAVHDFMETGANDVMIVRVADEKNLLVPLVDEVVAVMDPELGGVYLEPMAQWAAVEVKVPALDAVDQEELFGAVLDLPDEELLEAIYADRAFDGFDEEE